MLSCAQLKTANEVRIVERYPAPEFLDKRNLSASAVILDARPYYDYLSGHLEKAYWQDYQFYMQRDNLWPPSDLSLVSMSLSRKGIGPDSEVLVLGKGVEGNGEECRIAWTLFYMGVSKVSFVRHDFLKAKLSREKVSLPQKRAPIWKPEVQKDLLFSWNNLIDTMEKKEKIQILDVRSEQNFLKQNFYWDAEVDAQLANVYWKDFLIDKSSLPNKKNIQRLKKIGFDKDKTTMVIDADGLSGACVAMALMANGYKKVGYYAGSYQDLAKKWKK